MNELWPLEAASKALGTALRMKILSEIGSAGALGIRELTVAVGKDRKTVEHSVKILEDCGLLTGDRPKAERNGHLTRYSVDDERLKSLQRTLIETVFRQSN